MNIEAPPLWSNGPKPGLFYDFPGRSVGQSLVNDHAKTHTMYPTTTGTSVIGIVFDGGVMIAADKLGSYGSLARFRNVERIFKATDEAVLAFGGDIADYQFIREVIEQKVRDDECGGYSKQLDAGALHSWLTRVLYNRRSRFNPLWLDCVVAGFRAGKPFLGFVDKIGTAYEATEVASGFGQYFAIPMLRSAREKKSDGIFTQAEARKVIEEAMKVLYYRDCRGFHRYMVATVTKEGVTIDDDLDLKKDTNWDLAHLTKLL
ncbi:proteasome subunit beta type-4 [Hyalella azteca]|uniref:Proteasome subunit beta n=1 Tax=Hyalella azteca TaxID=294128 RepID=A0A8B7P4A0_HYAAZ|nr:proteasome subunit beta type-4 [Hyalella azteca]